MSDLAHALFEQSPFSTVIYDAGGHVLALNAAFTALWGVTLADVPRDYTVLDDPQLEAQGALPFVRRAFAGETVLSPPVRYDLSRVSTSGEGRAVWTQGHFFPVRDEAGRLTNVVLIHLDITDRMATDAALRAAADRTARLQEVTAAFARGLTTEQIARTALTQGLTALGATAGVVYTMHRDGDALDAVAWDGIPVEALEPWLRVPIDSPMLISDAVRIGESIYAPSREETLEHYPTAREANRLIVQDAWAAIPLIQDGRAVGALALGFERRREFTLEERAFIEAVAQQCATALDRARAYAEEKRARAVARRAVERLQTLVDASRAIGEQAMLQPAALVALAETLATRLGDQCTIRLVSDDGAWLEPVAVAHHDPAQAALLRSLAATERYSIDDGLTGRVFRTGEAVHYEAKDHATLADVVKPAYRPWLDRVGMRSVVCVPMRGHRGIIGTLFVARDDPSPPYDPEDVALLRDLADRAALVVERVRSLEAERQARRDAEEANRVKSDFLAAMSHELRTPLNGIAGYVDLMLMGVRGPITNEQRIDLERIRRNEQHLLSLIDDVLSFARVEAGKLEVDETAVPLDETLRSLEAMVMPQLAANGIRFAHVVCDPALRVVGDRDRIVQIVVNLLTNAAKATPSGGTVTLSCTVERDRVCVHVADTGIGIPEEKREAIFSPFTQLERSLHAPRGGAGLGLSISRALAEAMHGTLTVESRVGVGSIFTLALKKAG